MSVILHSGRPGLRRRLRVRLHRWQNCLVRAVRRG